MTEVSTGQIQSTTLDHLGLVAAMCQDLKIAQRIDDRIKPNSQRKVSVGIATVAMILNGLGFTNRRLYLTHQFFESKAIERLLGSDFEAKDISEYTLGHALDDIAAYGSSKLFSEIAFEIAVKHNLLGRTNHLDTTSIAVHGQYEVDDDANIIEVTRGFSKDNRPDLKQVVLSLVVSGPGSVPLWMEPLNGNSSDKTSFHETIKSVREFQKQINLEDNAKWIADSALYTKEGLLKSNDYIWVTRVPESIGEAKRLVAKEEREISWIERENGYKTASYKSFYGGIEQRWLLVFSEQACKREKKTLEKKLEKEDEKLKKTLREIERQEFHCEKDAFKTIEMIRKENQLYSIEGQIIPVSKHASRGKPKKGAEKSVVAYRIETNFMRNQEEITCLANKKGRFILATNELNQEEYKDNQILEEYKEQQKVEGGFRFLKDPWFMVSSIFLKRPERIEALMMVMTLCLLVYNVAQYTLRERLKKTVTTLPNQVGKQISNPTLKWIFQIMEGIGVVYFYDESLSITRREVITNLNEVRKKIIWLFGRTAAWIYGIFYEKPIPGLGM